VERINKLPKQFFGNACGCIVSAYHSVIHTYLPELQLHTSFYIQFVCEKCTWGKPECI